VSSQVETSNPPGGTTPPRTRRLLVWLLVGAAAVVALLLVAAVVALRTVDLSGFTSTILAAVQRETGRQLRVGKGPYARLSLPPSVVAEDVTFANATWGSRKEMLRVKRIELRLKLLALLRGEILVDRLVLVEPDLLLETDQKGEGNWVFASASEAAAAEKPSSERSLRARLGIREARMTDALLAYHDGCAGWQASMAVRRLALTASRTVSGGLNLDAALGLGRATVSVTGATGSLDTILGDRPLPLKLALSTKGATANLEGTIQRVRDLVGVDLKVILEVSDPPALAASLGATWPRLAPFRIECQVRDSGKVWALDPVRVTAGRSSVSGSVGYVMGCPRSRITLDLRAPLVDLPELTRAGMSAPAASKAPAAKGEKLFPVKPLPLNVLKAFDVTADVRLESLVLPSGTEIQSLVARAVLANGRLAVEPLSLKLGGGRITGSLRLDAGRRQSFAANLAGNNVELRALLGLMGVRADVSGGPTDLAVALAGSGASLHDWMASLGGKVRVVVGPGRLEGAALSLGADVLTEALATVNPFQKTDRSTELRCAVINVPVEAGVVRLDRKVAAETSKISIAVGGTANLGTETLDVGFLSKATQGLGIGLANFAGAVRIRGPLTNPALGPDAEGTALAATTLHSAVRTHGRSLVQDRIRDSLFPESPCKAALSEDPPARRSLFDLFRRR
jgi:AsmA family protein